MRVAEDNKRAIRCYENCGFAVEGILREDHFAHDEWHDSLIMSVLNDKSRGKRK